MFESVSPKTPPRALPICIGPVGFADTNSTITFFPTPSVFIPYFSPVVWIKVKESEYQFEANVKLINPGPAIVTEEK